jgi:hypothetical protein
MSASDYSHGETDTASYPDARVQRHPTTWLRLSGGMALGQKLLDETLRGFTLLFIVIPPHLKDNALKRSRDTLSEKYIYSYKIS